MAYVPKNHKALDLALNSSEEIIKLWELQETPLIQLARRYGVNEKTMYKTLMLLGYKGPRSLEKSVRNIAKYHNKYFNNNLVKKDPLIKGTKDAFRTSGDKKRKMLPE